MTDREMRDHNRFVREGLHDPDLAANGMNTVYEFPRMTKAFGRAYLDHLVASYACHLAEDGLTDAEWAHLNGNVPDHFTQNRVRPAAEALGWHKE